MSCCSGCFDNPHAKALVRSLSRTSGDCDWCGRNRVQVVDESDLREPFANLVGQYARFGEVELGPFADGLSPGVDTLIRLVQEEWGIFADDLFVSGRAAGLLDSITDEGRHDPKEDDQTLHADDICASRRDSLFRVSAGDLWLDRRKGFLARGARLTLDAAELRDALTLCAARLKRGSTIYRARVGYRASKDREQRRPWDGRRLGAPPPNRTPPGRANVKGRPVFYGADEPETAIAEVRPAVGHVVTVGSFRLKRPAKIVDLVHPPRPPNPFANDVWEVLDLEEQLEAFGAELATPLTRADRPATDYKPSQVICRTIRRAGYHGIRYPSAMRPRGSNLVLFDPASVVLKDAELVRVTDVAVTTEHAH